MALLPACLSSGNTGGDDITGDDDYVPDYCADVDVGAPCDTGDLGICGVGEIRCKDGQETCAGPDRTAETCANPGADDDCDGTIDDIPGLGEDCDTGLPGVCSNGLKACSDGEMVCGPFIEVGDLEELCTNPGTDDDCNGTVDDVPGLGDDCDTGHPSVCSVGLNVCSDGEIVCEPNVEVGERWEMCGNGEDDDCDGDVDEIDCADCVQPTESCHAEIHDGRCYFFCTEAVDWVSAGEVCSGGGHHILTIDDAEEDSWVDATADSWAAAAGLDGTAWWMGFNDRMAEGTWVWEDGSAIGFTNWRRGEPNDLRDEDCGQICAFHPEIGWNDAACDVPLPYVCEQS